MDTADFNEIVKTAMKVKKVNKSQIAIGIGCSKPYICDLLRNKRRWNDDFKNKVCDFLGIEISYKISESNLEQKEGA